MAWKESRFLVVPLAALACCQSNRPAASGSATRARSAQDVTWQEPIEVAVGDAHVGPWRQNESKYHYVDNPTVVIASDGAVAIAWVDNRKQNVLFQKYDPTGRRVFDRPVDVSKSPGVFSWLPQLEMSDDGRQIFVLWQEIVFSGGPHGGEIFFARSTDGGRSFAEPLNLSQSRAGDGKGRLTKELWHNGSLDLARNTGGTLYAAWTEYDGKLWFSRSTDGGEQFSRPMHVAGTYTSPARGPGLAAGAGETVYLAWTVGEDDAADIRFAGSSDGGQSFGKARALFESSGHSDAPRIAVDTKGDVHLVYAESPSGRRGPYHIRYARLHGHRSSRQPVRIGGPPRDGVSSAYFPNLSLAGDDAVLVTWAHYPHRRRRPLGLGFAVSTDRGLSFGAPSLVPGSAEPALGFNGGLQGFLMQILAVNDVGSIAIASSHFDENKTSRVRLIRGRLSL